MRVAVTRAAPEAEHTARRVRDRGHEAIVAPLLSIVPCAFDTNTENVQAVLITSMNGARALAALSGELPALAVGDATADTARAAGFKRVHSAGGDVRALAALAKAMLQPDAGKLLHLSGDHVAGDLASDLAPAGFVVERRIAYLAEPAPRLPAAYHDRLDMVLFHSARAAEIYVGLGAPGAAGRTAACLSPFVAAAAAKAPWAALIVAPQPRESALLDIALPV